MFGYKFSPALVALAWVASIAATYALARQPTDQPPPSKTAAAAAVQKAKPPQIDLAKAEDLRYSFQRVLADARLLDRRTTVHRIEQAKAAQALAAESEKMFGDVNGPYSQCAQAGGLQHSLLIELNSIAHGLETGRAVSMLEVGQIANLGFMLGDRGGACRQMLDELSSAK
jgi:hypothetical protein